VHFLVLACLRSYVQAIGLLARLWHCACGHVVSGLLFPAEHDCLKAFSSTCLKLNGHVQQHVQQEWTAWMWWRARRLCDCLYALLALDHVIDLGSACAWSHV
jgi:hypothetical protein